MSSPAAYITIIITPVNDLPFAVSDTAQGVAGVPLSISVLANDGDVDGLGDLGTAVIAPQPAGASATIGVGGVVTFSAPAGGTYTFTYVAQDRSGAESAPAAVTVTVVASEVLTVTRAEYAGLALRWRVEGTDNVRNGQTVTVTYDNGTFLNGTSHEAR